MSLGQWPLRRLSCVPCPGIYILIAVGAVMMFVGFLGCYGAIQESQCLLGTVGPGQGWGAGGGHGLTPAAHGRTRSSRETARGQELGRPRVSRPWTKGHGGPATFPEMPVPFPRLSLSTPWLTVVMAES